MIDRIYGQIMSYPIGGPNLGDSCVEKLNLDRLPDWFRLSTIGSSLNTLPLIAEGKNLAQTGLSPFRSPKSERPLRIYFIVLQWDVEIQIVIFYISINKDYTIAGYRSF
jgi:hypothetical protein